MIHDIMPGTEELLEKETATGYIGFDPTADSLHIGHMVQVMLLVHFQRAGHTPIALVGGATGMIGDPSGKSEERNLLDEATLRKNEAGLKKQLSRFLDFSPERKNRALMVNNYDWMKDYSFLGFIRDIGKHITVNYMMSKDSVKKRLGSSRPETECRLRSFLTSLFREQIFCIFTMNLAADFRWGDRISGVILLQVLNLSDVKREVKLMHLPVRLLQNQTVPNSVKQNREMYGLIRKKRPHTSSISSGLMFQMRMLQNILRYLPCWAGML